jgi:hypothetical protein
VVAGDPGDSEHDDHLPAAPEPSPEDPTPFGWAGGATSEEDGEVPAPPIKGYFDELLRWSSSREPGSGSRE